MKKRIASTLLIVSLGMASTGLCADHPILAVFDMNDRGAVLRQEVRANLVDFLIARLAEGGYQLVPRSQIRERISQEKRKSYESCFDQTCQIELGRELAAQKTLASQILQIGGQCQMTATLYDLKKSTTELAATAEAKCNEKALLLAVRKISEKLCRPLQGGDSSEFSRFLSNAKRTLDRKDQAEKSWEIIERLGTSDSIPASERAKALRMYVDEFGDESRHYQAAREMLSRVPATLTIATEPVGTTIWLDDDERGESPLVLRVDAGAHRIKASMTGFESKEHPVTVEPGETADVKISLQKILPATLVIATRPTGARILIDGRLVGTSPLERVVKAGRHGVVARLTGHQEASREVTAEMGKRHELSLTMEGIHPGVLVVRTEPRGASVELEDEEAGTSPVRTELSPGEYRVVTWLDGYAEEERVALVESGSESIVTIQLQRKSPYNRLGHAAFWSGLGLSVFGGISAVVSSNAADEYRNGDLDAWDRSKTWEGLMWTGIGAGAALVATGVVLWMLPNPDDYPVPALTPTPSAGGAVLSVSGRW